MRVGIGQLYLEGGKPEANLSNAIRMIQEASANQADIIVLPECIDFGWTSAVALTGAEPIPGRFSQALCDAASLYRIHIIAGLTEREGEKIYNSAILISPEGSILGKHRKINILDIARHIYSHGDSLSVIKTDLGMIGMNICADNLPETNALGHALALMGAEIILSPCSWAVPPDFNQRMTPYGDLWKQSYREIAGKHQIPVIGVSNTGLVRDGAWKGWWCIGASLVVSRDGGVQKQCDFTRQGSRLYIEEVN